MRTYFLKDSTGRKAGNYNSLPAAKIAADNPETWDRQPRYPCEVFAGFFHSGSGIVCGLDEAGSPDLDREPVLVATLFEPPWAQGVFAPVFIPGLE